MASVMEKLSYHISLIDNLSNPLKGISKSIKNLQQNITKGMWDITKSTAGIFKGIQPALEMSRAIGEVKSLGIADKELKLLEKTADNFAMKYGESAIAFVKSSYDIQLAITGLKYGELSKFTNASNILTKATKSDTSTIADYMGTMYSIFSKQAEAMGKINWVEQLIGQTAKASEMFKTNGGKMAAAFSKLGSAGEKAGMSIADQLAFMGNLQATMGGGESATKLISFIQGIGKAEKVLGMTFTDTQGKMLPMIQIMEKLKGRFGDLSKVADQDLIKKAFGKKEGLAFIQNLIGNTNKLTGDIQKLNNITGMKNAEKMAKSQTLAFDQFTSSLNVLRKNFGKLILYAINPFIGAMAKVASAVNYLMVNFPVMDSIIKYTSIAFVGLYLSISSLLKLRSIYIMILSLGQSFRFITAATKLWTAANWLLKISLTGFKRLIGVAGLIAYKGVMLAISDVTKTWTAVQWLLNIAMSANLVGFVIVAVIGLIAGIAALFYWYKDIEKAIGGSTWGKILLFIIDSILLPFRILWDTAKFFFNLITGNWDNISFGGPIMDYIGKIGSSFSWLLNLGQNLLGGLTSIFGSIGKGISGLWDKFKDIPGLSWFFGDESKEGAAGQTNQAISIPQINESKKLNIPTGGVINNSSASRSTNYGGVAIYSSGGMSPADLEEWNMLHA